MYARTYVFGTNSQKLNTNSRSREIMVTGEHLYDVESGYGFVTEENFQTEELLQMPELGTGFIPMYSKGDEQITHILTDDMGCYVEQENDNIPLCFRADVDRCGNYQVSVEYQAAGDVMIFTGPRRLVYRSSAKGQKQALNLVLNVCDIIPMGKYCIYERKSIDIALLGKGIHLCRINIKQTNCPTIYIAGDSTVNDQATFYPYHPEVSFGGWGQMLPNYLNGRIAVSNHAHSGQTVDTFRTEGHYAIIQAHIRFGDYLLIQFAHNDQKVAELKAESGYADALARYIEETLSIGAYPVLVTPLCRNTWRASGVYADFLEEYARTCKRVAQQYQIPFADLHEASKRFILQQGPVETARYFYPEDFTHTNDYGAYLVAGMVVKEYCSRMSGAYAEAYGRLAHYMTQQSPWLPQAQKIHYENKVTQSVWYEQDKEASGQITSVEELESMINR